MPPVLDDSILVSPPSTARPPPKKQRRRPFYKAESSGGSAPAAGPSSVNKGNRKEIAEISAPSQTTVSSLRPAQATVKGKGKAKDTGVEDTGVKDKEVGSCSGAKARDDAQAVEDITSEMAELVVDIYLQSPDECEKALSLVQAMKKETS